MSKPGRTRDDAQDGVETFVCDRCGYGIQRDMRPEGTEPPGLVFRVALIRWWACGPGCAPYVFGMVQEFLEG